MKASELRIGNLTNLGVVYKIEEDRFYVYDKDGTNFGSYWAKIEPIPLTEEWLLRFGFKYKKCGMCGQDQWANMDFWYIDTQSGEAIVLRGNIKNTKILYPHFTSIYYVHQLQNLYFAITGEELTIK